MEPPLKRSRRDISPAREGRRSYDSRDSRPINRDPRHRSRSRSHDRDGTAKSYRRDTHTQRHDRSRSRGHRDDRHNRDHRRDHSRDRQRERRGDSLRDQRPRNSKPNRSRSPGIERSGSGHSRNDRTSLSPIPPSQQDRGRARQNTEDIKKNGSSASLPLKDTLNSSKMDIDEDGDPEVARMKRMMGFAGFSSTKNTKVKGNNVYGIRKEKKTEYRQYMNRNGGFNRPLSPSR